MLTCDKCGRKSQYEPADAPCKARLPDGVRCAGRLRPPEDFAKQSLSDGEMLVFLLGAKIEREEKPTSAEDLVGQSWRRVGDKWEQVSVEKPQEEVVED